MRQCMPWVAPAQPGPDHIFVGGLKMTAEPVFEARRMTQQGPLAGEPVQPAAGQPPAVQPATGAAPAVAGQAAPPASPAPASPAPGSPAPTGPVAAAPAGAHPPGHPRPPAKPRLAGELQKHIGEQLRAMHNAVLDEKVPERFVALLRALAEKDSGRA